MIRISNISCFRFCWKNEKLDWPECARTGNPLQNITNTNESNEQCIDFVRPKSEASIYVLLVISLH